MWQALREIGKGVTFYKQFYIFASLCFIFGGGYFALTTIQNGSLIPQASTEVPAKLKPEGSFSRVAYDIALSNEGTATINNVPLPDPITLDENGAKLLVILTRESPAYIDAIDATVHLPTALADAKPRIYAIHGVGSSSAKQVDDLTLTFHAESILEQATVSIEATFPRNYFTFSKVDELQASKSTLPARVWLQVGLVVPIVTGVLLLWLVLRTWMSSLRVRNSAQVPYPPDQTPPAVLGALYAGHIGRTAITATLFDLAHRGFVTIHRGDGDTISFRKGKNLFGRQATSLRPFEIFLLHQIFGDNAMVSKDRDIEANLDKELFSSKIAMAILNMYDAVVAEGFFIKSPNSYYQKYKVIGITLFFIAVVAVFYGAFMLNERDFSLFVWMGMIPASLMIIGITPGLPRRTARGDATLQQWMAFRNYLADDAPIQTSKPSEFFAYLPHAIVLNCEPQWINRWREQVVVMPDWLSAESMLYTSDDYAASLLEVTDFIAKHILASRPPDIA